MRPMTSRSALPTQISTWHDWARASSTASSTRSSTSHHLAAAALAAAAHGGRACRSRGSASPGAAKPLDTTACRPGGRPAPRPRRPARPRPGGRRRRRPAAARRPGPRGVRSTWASTCWAAASTSAWSAVTGTDEPAAQPLAQVGMQVGLELAGQVRRGRRWPGARTDAGSTPRTPPGRRGAGAAGCAPPATWGWSPPRSRSPRTSVSRGSCLEQLGPLDQLAELEHEHAGPLAVGQQDADGLVLAQHRLELAHGGDVVDHHPGAHRHGQLDRPATGRRPSRRRSPGPGRGTGRGRRGRTARSAQVGWTEGSPSACARAPLSRTSTSCSRSWWRATRRPSTSR